MISNNTEILKSVLDRTRKGYLKASRLYRQKAGGDDFSILDTALVQMQFYLGRYKRYKNIYHTVLDTSLPDYHKQIMNFCLEILSDIDEQINNAYYSGHIDLSILKLYRANISPYKRLVDMQNNISNIPSPITRILKINTKIRHEISQTSRSLIALISDLVLISDCLDIGEYSTINSIFQQNEDILSNAPN